MSNFVVYTCLNSQRQALYVGQTNNLERRMREHELYSPWAGEVVEVLTVPTSTRSHALSVESRYIDKIRPFYNRAGNPRLKTVAVATSEAEVFDEWFQSNDWDAA